MKRSAELTPLSHDHHRALFVALQLKRAEGATASAAFIEFIEGEGRAHFRVEETILLPRWIAADPGADREAAARVLGEHLEMRIAAERMRAAPPSVAELHALGELLEHHVRFEERELFPQIEEALDEGTLAELGAAIAAAEAGR